MTLDNLTTEQVRAMQLDDVRKRLAARTQVSWVATLDNHGWCVLAMPDEGEPPGAETLARLNSGSPTSDTADACFIAAAPNDIAVLLAEVERLTGELHRMKSRPVEAEFSRLDTMWQQLVRERDEALAKAEQTRLAAYEDKSEFGAARAKMRERESDAFSRGAEAMRNQVLGVIEPYAQAPVDCDHAAGRAWLADRLAEHVRALPVPEVTP